MMLTAWASLEVVALRRELKKGQPGGQAQMNPPYEEPPTLYLTALPGQPQVTTHAPSTTSAPQLSLQIRAELFHQLPDLNVDMEDYMGPIHSAMLEAEVARLKRKNARMINNYAQEAKQSIMQLSGKPGNIWERMYRKLHR